MSVLKFNRIDSADNVTLKGQTEPRSNGATNGGLDTDDFLSRERAALGDDAAQFASTNDHAANVEDGDDDLLGGGSYDDGQAGGEEISQFESSFPAMDTRNEVRPLRSKRLQRETHTRMVANGPRRHNHRLKSPLPTSATPTIIFWLCRARGRT